MVKLILLLIGFGISVSVENPKNSIFWLCSMIVELFAKFPGHNTYFDGCMHGGNRDKATRWWSFNPRLPMDNMFDSLNLQCDGSHQHASWKPVQVGKRLQFPTADEAKYPFVLCQRVAFLLQQEAIARGFIFLKRCNSNCKRMNMQGNDSFHFAAQVSQAQAAGLRIFWLCDSDL